MPASELVQSLARGLTLLERIAEAEDGLSLVAASDAVGLKPTTAHNLLRTLAAHGYLEKVDSPTRYRLGSAAVRLADRQQARALFRRIDAAMLDLHRRFPRVRLSFAEPIGGEVTATRRVAPEQPGRLQRGLLQAMSPYASASALLHQALWPEERRAEHRRRHSFTELGAHHWGTLDALDAYLGRVREEGFARPDLRDADYRLAAPVFDAGGVFVGALGAYLPGATPSGGGGPPDPSLALVERELLAAAALAGPAAPAAARRENA